MAKYAHSLCDLFFLSVLLRIVCIQDFFFYIKEQTFHYFIETREKMFKIVWQQTRIE